jgi:phage/plasmid-associated DNA primase
VVEDSRADKAMPEKLRAEFSGILTWCVRSCLEWQKRGLAAPNEVVEATDSYRKEQDIIGAFLVEHTISRPDAKVKSSGLYACYKGWAETYGEHVMTQTMFGLMLQERGIEKGTSNGVIYKGIELKPASKPVADGNENGRVGAHFDDKQLPPARERVQPQESVPTLPTLPSTCSQCFRPMNDDFNANLGNIFS